MSGGSPPSEGGYSAGTPRTTPGVLLLYPLASVCEEGGDEREGAGPARPPVAIAVGREGGPTLSELSVEAWSSKNLNKKTLCEICFSINDLYKIIQMLCSFHAHP